MNKKVCVIIPIHPPNYKYITNIHESYSNDSDFMLLFVFTFNSDLELALKEYPELKEHACLSIEKEYFKYINSTYGIIHVKKFLGLDYCLKKFPNIEFGITLDSEIKFLRKYIYNDILGRYNKKNIYASRTPENIVMKTCSYYFEDLCDQLQISEEFNNFKMWSWWSDVPYYKLSDLKEFFECIKYKCDFKSSINIMVYAYDHILYQMFLVLHRNFKITYIDDKYDIHDKMGLEYGNTDMYTIMINDYKPIMVMNRLYNKDAECFNNIWVLIHLERIFN
jgi:hypothetical protein